MLNPIKETIVISHNLIKYHLDDIKTTLQHLDDQLPDNNEIKKLNLKALKQHDFETDQINQQDSHVVFTVTDDYDHTKIEWINNTTIPAVNNIRQALMDNPKYNKLSMYSDKTEIDSSGVQHKISFDIFIQSKKRLHEVYGPRHSKNT